MLAILNEIEIEYLCYVVRRVRNPGNRARSRLFQTNAMLQIPNNPDSNKVKIRTSAHVNLLDFVRRCAIKIC